MTSFIFARTQMKKVRFEILVFIGLVLCLVSCLEIYSYFLRGLEALKVKNIFFNFDLKRYFGLKNQNFIVSEKLQVETTLFCGVIAVIGQG